MGKRGTKPALTGPASENSQKRIEKRQERRNAGQGAAAGAIGTESELETRKEGSKKEKISEELRQAVKDLGGDEDDLKLIEGVDESDEEEESRMVKGGKAAENGKGGNREVSFSTCFRSHCA